MKDQLVSFETAKLAKEKGFEGSCNNWTCIGYASMEEDRSIKEYQAISDSGQIIGVYTVRSISKSQPHIALVPTQSLLKRWLREVHGLYVEMNIGDLDIEVWNYKDGEPEEPVFKRGMSEGYDSYEEALEDGLLEALNIINPIELVQPPLI